MLKKCEKELELIIDLEKELAECKKNEKMVESEKDMLLSKAESLYLEAREKTQVEHFE